MTLLINIDVPDLAAGLAFYRDAFGLSVGRRLGASAVELLGWPAPLWLLEKPEGSPAAPRAGAGSGADPGQPGGKPGGGPARERVPERTRSYARHWTPVHLDVVVGDVEAAVARALTAGATLESPATTHPWGTIAMLADPFGNGFCVLKFSEKGYDAIADQSA